MSDIVIGYTPLGHTIIIRDILCTLGGTVQRVFIILNNGQEIRIPQGYCETANTIAQDLIDGIRKEPSL